MRRQEDYRSYFQGCLAGLTEGDAYGLPLKPLTHEEILSATGGIGVRGLFSTSDRPVGATSDETQLSFALAQSLVDSDGLDLQDIARKLVREQRASMSGWGATTKRAVKAMGEFLDTDGKSGRNPIPRLEPSVDYDNVRCGNGVAMRIAPYALWHGTVVNRVDDLVKHVFMIGRQTHDDPRASIAAVAIAAAVSHLLYHGFIAEKNGEFFRKSVLDAVRLAEDKFVYGDRPVSQRLTNAYAVADSSRLLRTEVGTGGFALESIPFAIGTFLRHPTDLYGGILEAVNAGGDTDANASMVGAMIGVNVGVGRVGRGQSWEADQPAPERFKRAFHLGSKLYDMCLRTAPSIRR